MDRYFFHTECDIRHTDSEGVPLADMTAARKAAAESVAALLKDGAHVFWGTKPWTMTVTDERGLIFFVIEVHGQDAPAVMNSTR